MKQAQRLLARASIASGMPRTLVLTGRRDDGLPLHEHIFPRAAFDADYADLLIFTLGGTP